MNIPPINFKAIYTCLAWYTSSSITTQLTKKTIDQFLFPVFIGQFEFTFNFILGCILILIYDRRRSRPSLRFNSHLLKLYFPMGSLRFLGKLLNLAATAHCSVATVASIQALGPLLIVLAYRIYYKVQFPINTYLSLVPLVVGVVIMVVSQSHEVEPLEQLQNPASDDDVLANVLSETGLKTGINDVFVQGVFFAVASAIVFAINSIYGKNVVTYSNKKHDSRVNFASLALTNDQTGQSDATTIEEQIELDKLSRDSESRDPETRDIESRDIISDDISFHSRDYSILPNNLVTLIYCSMYGVLCSMPAFFSYEYFSLFWGQQKGTPNYMMIPWRLLLVTSLSHFVQSLLAFYILGMLPTVSYSVANMVKRIVVIVVSMVVGGKEMSKMEGIGILGIAVGLYVYNRWSGPE